MRVKIVYDPDDKTCGRTPHNADHTAANLPSGKTISFTSIINKNLNTKTDKPKGRTTILTDIPFNATNKTAAKQKLIDGLQNKKFEILKNRLLNSKSLYVDEEFKAGAVALGNLKLSMEVEWKRPKEINPNAEFIKDGIGRFDIVQGALGDCWLLAVMSSISAYPQLINHVCPVQNIKNPADYAGIFFFRFWQFGKWEEVIVDDLLPVKKGTKQLIFMHSTDQEEMWSALMEKAYAKLNGSYGNLVGGMQSEAMEDMTGGLCETIDLKNVTEDLIPTMQKYCKRCCLMGVSINSSTGEQKTTTGLIAGHAYSVTGVDYVMISGEKQWLVRVRNPWGNSVEWKGAWADRSSEWNSVSAADKKRLDVTFDSDGEFWMSFQDFATNFTKLEACHLGMESMEEDTTIASKSRLEETVFTGEFIANVNAGGCANFKESFWTNPQYKVVLPDIDPTDKEDMGQLAIGLMQKDVREKNGGQFFSIGFAIYKVDEKHQGLLDKNYLLTNKYVAISEFAAKREVVKRMNLKTGHYIIIPSTFKPNEEVKFIIRVMNQVKLQNSEVDNPNVQVGVTEEIRHEIHEKGHGKDDDAKVKKIFDQKKDKDGCINAEDLMEILNDSSMKNVKKFAGFTLEMCRSFIAVMDDDLSGVLNWTEFDDLWENCEVWKYIFEKYDDDHSGCFDAFELRNAIQTAGYSVSNRVFAGVVSRFSDPVDGHVLFGDFILLMTRLKNTFENMNSQPKTTTGERIFTEEDYMRYALYI